MKRQKKIPRRLGDLQLKIMKALWARGSATVGEVQSDLSGTGSKPLAYTTMATMLRKMEARGLVRHRQEGRAFVYEAACEEDSVTQNLTDDLVEKLFEGSLSGLVSHFLSARDVSEEELNKLEKMVRDRKRLKKGK